MSNGNGSKLSCAIILFALFSCAGWLYETIENIFTRVGQVVYNNDIIACILKFYSSVRTDESGTTCYEDCLFHFIIEYVLIDALKLMFITTSRCKCSRFFDMVKGFIKKNEH